MWFSRPTFSEPHAYENSSLTTSKCQMKFCELIALHTPFKSCASRVPSSDRRVLLYPSTQDNDLSPWGVARTKSRFLSSWLLSLRSSQNLRHCYLLHVHELQFHTHIYISNATLSYRYLSLIRNHRPKYIANLNTIFKCTIFIRYRKSYVAHFKSKFK